MVPPQQQGQVQTGPNEAFNVLMYAVFTWIT